MSKRHRRVAALRWGPNLNRIVQLRIVVFGLTIAIVVAVLGIIVRLDAPQAALVRLAAL